ncbi:MAG: RNA polymerase sigma factor [Ruminococcus sp.]
MIIDEVLYERFWNGEKTAADELVHRHGDMLVLFLNSYVKDIHEAEDLMIEAFAQMFVRRRSVSEDGSFRAYLYKTARRLAGNAIKKNTEYILDWKNFLSSCRGEALAETSLFENERKKQLYEAMEELKPEYQEALYLVYFEDMSYQGTAEVMGRSESQIKNLVHRGKKSLKELLGKNGFEY